jgi:hypothetical protein
MPITPKTGSKLHAETHEVMMKRCLSTMLRLPKDLHQPYLIVIDEVQRFAPQHGAGKASGAIVKAVKEGRKLGLSVLVATQRIADVSKSVTSQMTSRLFGHVSDASDRKRIAEELGMSSGATAFLSAFGKGDFLVRGEAFGGELQKVQVRLPVTGRKGNDHLVAQLDNPVIPIEDLRAQLGARARPDGAVTERATGAPAPGTAAPATAAILPVVACGQIVEDETMETALFEILVQQGRGGMSADMLALLIGTTERRKVFQEAVSGLLASRLIAMGSGGKLRVTPSGLAATVDHKAARTPSERLALLRAQRDRSDERLVACLSAAGGTPLDVAELRKRTGLGPRVAKAALQRLKRDCWVVERRGAFAISTALAGLIGRR